MISFLASVFFGVPRDPDPEMSVGPPHREGLKRSLMQMLEDLRLTLTSMRVGGGWSGVTVIVWQKKPQLLELWVFEK